MHIYIYIDMNSSPSLLPVMQAVVSRHALFADSGAPGAQLQLHSKALPDW